MAADNAKELIAAIATLQAVSDTHNVQPLIDVINCECIDDLDAPSYDAACDVWDDIDANVDYAGECQNVRSAYNLVHDYMMNVVYV